VNIRVVLTKLVRIVLIFIATLIALSAVGLDITLLSVFGGALGVGLGFGLQRIASNYVSGFIILLDKSMQIGDVISVDKHYGMVSDMRSRYMVLSKPDGTHVIIPNETLITTAVINHSLTEHKGRLQIELAIGADSALELALQLLEDLAKQHKRVLATPTPAARIKGFSDNGVQLTLTAWVSDPENGVLSLQSELFMDIWKVFKKNKIMFVKTEIKQE
jgi:small-conductance mechanosensitive channel